VEGSWPDDRGVAILSFPSLRDAELWKDSVPEIRQHDWLDGVDFVIVPITSLPRQYMHYTLHSYLSYKYVNIITSANKAEVMWHYYREVHRKLAVGNSDLVDTNRIKSQLESNFREVKSSRLTLTWGPFHSNKGQGSCSSLGSTWGHYSLK